MGVTEGYFESSRLVGEFSPQFDMRWELSLWMCLV